MYRTNLYIVKPVRYPHSQITIVDDLSGSLERRLEINGTVLGKASKLTEDVSENKLDWGKVPKANGLYKSNILGPTIWDKTEGMILYRDGKSYMVGIDAINQIKNWWWQNPHRSLDKGEWFALIGWALVIGFLLWAFYHTFLFELLGLLIVN